MNLHSTDELEIRSLLASYAKALNTSDAEAAVAVYAPEGVFYPYNLPTATGADALLAAYQQIFATIKLEIAFDIQDIQIAGDLAYATTGSAGHVTVLEPGITLAESNREVFTFARVDGAWKVTRYMFNKASDPAAGAQSA